MIAVAVLFAAGVLLIFSEFFVPGITLGVVGSILIISSIVVGWVRYPEYGVFILGGETLGVVVTLALGLFLLAKTPLGRGFVLEAKQDSSEDIEKQSLVGKVAVVHTALRPAGSLLIDRRRVDAVSNGTFVDAGKTVRIIKVEGHRVVCEEETAADGGRNPK